MVYSHQQKAQFVIWFIEEGYSYAEFKTRVGREVGRGSVQVPIQGRTKVKFDRKTNFLMLMSSEFAGDELSNDI